MNWKKRVECLVEYNQVSERDEGRMTEDKLFIV